MVGDDDPASTAAVFLRHGVQIARASTIESSGGSSKICRSLFPKSRYSVASVYASFQRNYVDHQNVAVGQLFEGQATCSYYRRGKKMEERLWVLGGGGRRGTEMRDAPVRERTGASKVEVVLFLFGHYI